VIKLPVGVDVKNLIDNLKNFSWEAADIFLYYSEIVKNSELKNKILKNNNINDPVTLVDLEVNELIIKRINQRYKNINWEILSEENFKIKTNHYEKNADWVWVLDPLDGTKDFIQGTGNYAMHLALNYKQKPIIGVVLIPEKNELWIAHGEKLWCEERYGKICKQKLSETRILQEMTLVTSKNHRNENLSNLILKIDFKK
jgi:3'(2'), 5'-bisphosphate nucleotidase